MRYDNYQELNSIFWNNLNTEKIEMLTNLVDENKGVLYSSRHRELIQKILDNSSFNNVLAPAFGLGLTISSVKNKRIVAFEENDSFYKLAKLIWEDKDINLINSDFLREDVVDKYEAIIFTSPCGWVKTAERGVRLEREYINKALNCLDNNGIMVVTVPSNVLTATLWQETRQII
ncbi:MAG: hypothetical protein GX638_05645 [Crenarchaeota archaeon]|jgi:hypothetical protein|nr:hypothetical protein [Thermoproteota archaeon]